MTTNAKITELCRYAIDHGFTNLPADTLPGVTIWATYNGYGTVTMKLYRANQMFYSRQFSLFDHDFARALFSDEPAMFAAQNIKKDETGDVYMAGISWAEYHMQVAVISDDPIKTMHEAVFHA